MAISLIMIFEETKLKRAFIIRPERFEDERGFFAQSFCMKEFNEHDINMIIAQTNISFNKIRGTFRGMHFQAPPFSEAKLVSCSQGSIIDYIVDLRPGSPTFGNWISVELSSENRLQLYIPQLFAQGFITSEANTQVISHVSQFYNPQAARGFRYDDPSFNIKLPLAVETISEKDKSWPAFQYPDIFQLQGK